MTLSKVGKAAAGLGALWALGGVGFVIAVLLRNPPDSFFEVLGGLAFVFLYVLPGLASSALVAWSASSADQMRFVKEARWGAVAFSLVSLLLVWATIIAGGYFFAPLALASVVLALVNVRRGRHGRRGLAENA